MQTDCINLYQTHWPDHGTGYDETMEVLDELVRAGNVRIFGYSNETSWGLMKSLAASERLGTERFLALAAEAGLHPITMANVWSKQHDFVASTIVGATHADQLPPILAAADLVLSDDVMKAIYKVSVAGRLCPGHHCAPITPARPAMDKSTGRASNGSPPLSPMSA